MFVGLFIQQAQVFSYHKHVLSFVCFFKKIYNNDDVINRHQAHLPIKDMMAAPSHNDRICTPCSDTLIQIHVKKRGQIKNKKDERGADRRRGEMVRRREGEERVLPVKILVNYESFAFRNGEPRCSRGRRRSVPPQKSNPECPVPVNWRHCKDIINSS